MNDKTAKLLSTGDPNKDGVNAHMRHLEYECPCGKGKIIYEHVVGFGDFYAWIECKKCNEEYDIFTACGCLWELRKKSK